MMVKMKKALGSLALVLALAMAASLLPTIALATGNAVTINPETGQNPYYNQDSGTVSVSGQIDNTEADVTVLAVRSANKLEDTDFLGTENIEASIVYIDQVGLEDTGNFEIDTTDNTKANWDFTFIPKTGVSGGWITVFVGGTDVGAVKLASFPAQIAAPGLTANPWYKGDDLVMSIHKSGEAGTSYGGKEAIEKWAAKISQVLVNGTAFTDYTIDSEAATITFEVDYKVTSINITTTGNEYSVINMTPLALEPDDRPAGTIEAVSEEGVVVENDATLSFNLTDSDPAGWLAAIDADAVTYKVADGDFQDVSNYVLSDGVLTLGVASIEGAESKDFTVKIAVPNYEEKTATVTVVAPTVAALDAFSNANAVYGYKDTQNLATSDYGVTVTTPAEGLYESEVNWKLQIKDGENWVDVDELVSGEEYLLGRGDESFLGGVYQVVATISKGSYAEKIWTKGFSVSAHGVAGVDVKVTTNFAETAIASIATLKIMDGTELIATLAVDAGTQDFKAANITAGTYKLVIARPGYVTFTVDCTVGSELTNGITVALPAMVFGDMNDDGKVNSRDYNTLLDAYGANSADAANYSVSCDFNADSKVNSRDYNSLLDNYGYSK